MENQTQAQDQSPTTTMDQQTINEGKSMALVAYITLIGFLIAYVQNGDKKNQFVAYHLRQSIGIMLTMLVLVIAGTMLSVIFMFISTTLGSLIGTLFSFSYLLGLVLMILGILNANNGKAVPVPIFGKMYEKWFANMQK